MDGDWVSDEIAVKRNQTLLNDDGSFKIAPSTSTSGYHSHTRDIDHIGENTFFNHKFPIYKWR